MDSQYEEVAAWLKEVFGQSSVPEFEINPHTVQFLYTMCQKYRRRTQENNLLADELNRRAAQYANECKSSSNIKFPATFINAFSLLFSAANHLRRVLGSAGFTLDGITSQGVSPQRELVETAKELAQLALLLETPETDAATLMGTYTNN